MKTFLISHEVRLLSFFPRDTAVRRRGPSPARRDMSLLMGEWKHLRRTPPGSVPADAPASPTNHLHLRALPGRESKSSATGDGPPSFFSSALPLLEPPIETPLPLPVPPLNPRRARGRASIDAVTALTELKRSLDFDVVSALVQLAAGPASLATTIRLMAGENLATEGFVAGQVGSSAMPHKMNARSCERVNGFVSILRGHLTMVGGLVGGQWNEGDVSCSVVRRVALPDAFLAIDGLYETFLTVLDGFGAFPAVVDRELAQYLPFVATTRMLMAAVKAGAGREAAHELIKEHAIAAALALREQESIEEGLVDRLAAEERFPLGADELDDLMAEPMALAGRSTDQVRAIVARVAAVADRHPQAAAYDPAAIF